MSPNNVRRKNKLQRTIVWPCRYLMLSATVRDVLMVYHCTAHTVFVINEHNEMKSTKDHKISNVKNSSEVSFSIDRER